MKTEIVHSESSAIEYLEVAGVSVRQVLGNQETSLDEGMICLCLIHLSYAVNPGIINRTLSQKRILTYLRLVIRWFVDTLLAC